MRQDTASHINDNREKLLVACCVPVNMCLLEETANIITRLTH